MKSLQTALINVQLLFMGAHRLRTVLRKAESVRSKCSSYNITLREIAVKMPLYGVQHTQIIIRRAAADPFIFI